MPGSPRRAAGARWPGRALAAVAVLALAGLGSCAGRGGDGPPAGDMGAGPGADGAGSVPAGSEIVPGSGGATPEPTPPRRSFAANLLDEDVTADQLAVPPEPPAAGTWRVMDDAGMRVSFDACRPVPYRIRVGPGPADAEALVHEAVARLGEATGLRFVFDGFVDEVPDSSSYQPAGVSVRRAFSPVVVGWAQRDETDLWASEGADTLGVGGPRTIEFANGSKMTVSGFALLKPSQGLRPGFGPGLTIGNVLLHELAHVVGLDHVDDPDEIMQVQIDHTTPDGWGPGDRRGLWELGASRGCASTYLGIE